jgi:EAL domain-containing protein (putative c-di-GMP-specific phosphodiesterase class I)
VWGKKGPAIAINLSATQFSDPEIVTFIQARFAESGIDTRRLKIEITEHTLIEDFKTTTTTLNQLRQIGVAVAIDDFGTGFSSLQYLRDLPVAAIKLDRSFVHNLGAGAGDHGQGYFLARPAPAQSKPPKTDVDFSHLAQPHAAASD